ncbi:MAG: sensor histidine kinase [Rhodoglobus sp.]
MDLISKERNRLLQRTARAYGLSFTAMSLAMLSIPEAIDPTAYFLCLPLFIVLGTSQFRMGRSLSLGWVITSIGAGLAIVMTMGAFSSTLNATGAAAYLQVAGGATAASAIVLTNYPKRRVILVISALVVTLTATVLAVASSTPFNHLSLIVVGWSLTAFLGFWISAGVPRVVKRIQSIGRAHRAERQASETEAQRRQGARLLHDTVLATLTLLAHSGVGVSPDALREQAADDARLLRQLRLGATPSPRSSGGYVLEGVQETVLGTTLESVKNRFSRIGLEVSWHGTGQVLLSSDVLDAFLLALAECLENVRRHSGVTEAHVTITDNDTMVRAMITDSGVGFSLDDVDSARLGFKESVVGRLQEVGGRARLFSSPGAGTTVVLEVPR